MKKLVNGLTIFRIVVAIAMLPMFLFGLKWWMFGLFAIAGFSDLFDGMLARKYNVSSKLGGVMDQIGDKLLVVVAMIIMIMSSGILVTFSPFTRVWFVLVPAILLIVREIYISGLREFVGTQKMEMPVPKNRFCMGKIKAFFQMFGLGAFFLLFAVMGIRGPVSEFVLLLIRLGIITLPYLFLVSLWIALVSSFWSATEYTIDFAKKVKHLK
ncbi:MAG: CDP-alcohol phosphatidyltransferase family protein [Rickettsiales bacterium]|nr:CDP-alcohol phosphatidyltransferase family protein [Rickettsiales bacterium]